MKMSDDPGTLTGLAAHHFHCSFSIKSSQLNSPRVTALSWSFQSVPSRAKLFGIKTGGMTGWFSSRVFRGDISLEITGILTINQGTF